MDGKMGHTPGPWKAVAGLSLWNVTTTMAPRTLNICSINTHRMEQEANARLIAAAPDLLEALKDAVLCIESAQEAVRLQTGRAFSHDGPTAECLRIARAAIARAEGRD